MGIFNEVSRNLFVVQLVDSLVASDGLEGKIGGAISVEKLNSKEFDIEKDER